MEAIYRSLLARLEAMPGETALYYRPLPDGPVLARNADLPLMAASVIKLPVMIEVFRRLEAGLLRPDTTFEIRPEHKLPSCGALTYMHDGLRVTLMDLVTLMIIVSDNTAANLLIDLVGMDSVNRAMADLGARGTVLRRRLFDAEASARGLENTVTAGDMGLLLEGLYAGRIVSPAASAAMLGILRNQRLNGKLPFFLDCPVAHKTGEDAGITHDVGIVYAPKPFALCMLSNHTDAPGFNRLIQDAAKALKNA